MNRSKIDWCDHTWNPITGCLHGCPYCYARTMTTRFSGDVRRNKMAKENYCTMKSSDGKSELYILNEPMKNETGCDLVYPFGFEPTFHRYRMNAMDRLKMGNNIFVGAMADIFGEWVPDEWIKEIVNYCIRNPQHNYLFLTKNPERYWELEDKGLLPAGDNMWYGYSYTTSNDNGWASKYGDKHNFVSVEPLLEEPHLFDEHMLCPAAQWVIIGAETGRRKNKVVPQLEWVEKILAHCDKFRIPVFMKNSMLPIVGEENMRREFPEQLKHKKISEKLEQKLYEACCGCGTYRKKSEMVSLSAKSKRKENPKTFCYLCRNCFEKFCKEHGIEVPKLAYMEEERNEK